MSFRDSRGRDDVLKCLVLTESKTRKYLIYNSRLRKKPANSHTGETGTREVWNYSENIKIHNHTFSVNHIID